MTESPPKGDVRKLLEQEFWENARAVRRRSFTIPFAIAVVGLAFAPAIPGIGTFLGFSVWTSVPVFLGMLGIHLALVMVHGGDEKTYLVLDAFETVLHVAGYGVLIVSSGRALAIPWFFLSMQAQIAPIHPWGWVHRTAYVAMPVAVAGFFAWRGQRDDALLSVVLGVGVLIILRVATSALGERVKSRLRIAELERQLERSRIAMELHDGIGADLTAVILRARSATEKAKGEERATLEALVTRLRAALAELRSIVWAVREPSLSATALAAQLRSRAAELVPSPIACSVEASVPADAVIPGDLSVLVLRVVQESVNNAARHANATTVGVRLVVDDEALLVEVADDGRFRETESPGHGLANLRHRVEQAGGRFEVDAAGDGTTVRARLKGLQTAREPAD